MKKLKMKLAVMLLLSTLLLTLPVWQLVPSSQAEPAQPLNLHSQNPLVPIHMHGPALQPIHMHCTQGIVPINPPEPYTLWHELYPEYCPMWYHTSWEDMNQNNILDTGDQIDMTNAATEEVRWYHVDRVTMTMRVTVVEGPPQPDMYVEFKGPYTPYIQPVSTLWHEVYPTYSNIYHIISWYDNGNGYLDVCDYIEFETLPGIIWHVEEYATDLILNEKIMDPIDIIWHELYPEFCTYYTLTSWEESSEDLYPGRLSPGDQIDMTEEVSQTVTWYHVDRVTLTLKVSYYLDPDLFMYIEYKGPFETMYNVKTAPLESLWHEVYPEYCPVFQIIGWRDNCNGVLSYCDYLDLLDLETQTVTSWHVEELSIDLILNEKIMDPTCTYWNELHPEYGNTYHIIGWEDDIDRRLSPRDKVYLDPGPITPYTVTDVTLTLLVSLVNNPAQTMYIEFTGGFQHLYEPKTNPVGTWWHEVYPDYCLEFLIMDWIDNCNGVLSYCDNITLMDMSGFPTLWHVEELAVDITVQEPVHDVAVISVTPLFGSVFQGWPDPITVDVQNQGDFPETFIVSVYYAPIGEVTTSPITVTDLAPGATKTLTFCWVTKDAPLGEYTIFANASYVSGETDLADNSLQDGNVTILAPPAFYWKEGFCDYAPSGVPDFDQKQWGTYNWTDKSDAWSHCGPVAVANSIWWLDSEFEPTQPPKTPPTVSDGFPLVTSYLPGLDDHDPVNVQPLIEHLAYLMDTDGRRTGLAHSGTYVNDMEAGLSHYLSWTGVNPKGDVNGDGVVNQTDVDIVTAALGSTPISGNWNMAADIYPVTLGWPNKGTADNKVNQSDLDLVNANLGNTSGFFYEHTVDKPEFYYIEEEVEKCQDVVLLLGYWYWTGESWYREGGHFVTVAGVNSDEFKIAISDPCYDAFENQMIPEGRVPIPHPHGIEPPYITHNDAAYVSHDIYNVAQIIQFVPPTQPCPGGNWTLVNYVGWQPTPPFFTVIESAVITSPVGVHDINITHLIPNKTVVAKGKNLNITATILNEGTFTESFNVIFYANTTQIGNKTVNNLAPGNSINVTLVWNTTGFARAYIISANVTILPGETDTVDNTRTYGIVKISCLGDINGDYITDGQDYQLVKKAVPSSPGSPKWNPNADLNDDGIVDGQDFQIVKRNIPSADP